MQDTSNNISLPPPQADALDPDQVVQELSGLAPSIYKAFEAGTMGARAYFANRSESIEPYHFASQTRYEARQHLVRAGHRVDFELGQLANNGLILTYGDYCIRIRKSDDGKVPVPGGSSVLQDFYQQVAFRFGDGHAASRTNLLILWDVIKPSYALAPNLYLAYPLSGGLSRDSVVVGWMVAIPHVIETVGKAPQRVPDAVDEPADLDISLSDEDGKVGDIANQQG